MKQITLLIVLLVACGVGSLFHPFWAILLYYLFAVLRPQHLWEWAIPYDVRWSLIAALTVFVSVGLNFSKVINKTYFNAIATLMSAYGIVLLLSLLNAHNPDLAQIWGVEYVKILLMALIASLIINRLWQIRIIATMILVALGYIAWEVNFLYIFNHRLDIFHYGFAGLDNNGAGIMLAMGMPFAYVFGVTAPKWWQRGIAWFIGVLMLHALLMTYSRGAMLSATIGVVWLLFHYRSRLKAAVIALVLCVAIGMLAGQEIQDRFMSTADYKVDGSAQSRLDSWAAAWTIAWDHPLTGQGIRNSGMYIQNYGADKQGRTIHSQYLQIAADSGIVAMSMYVAMLVTSLYFLGKSRKKCSAYLYSANSPGGPLCPPDHEVELAEQIALGCQTCLIIFATGGLFLSLEVVELPWLMMVLAGAMPRALDHHMHAKSETHVKEQQPIPVIPGLPPNRPSALLTGGHGLVPR